MPQGILKEPLLFPNNKRATAVFPTDDTSAGEILAALDLKPHKTVILVIGGADNIDEKLAPRLVQLFGRGIARAAANIARVGRLVVRPAKRARAGPAPAALLIRRWLRPPRGRGSVWRRTTSAGGYRRPAGFASRQVAGAARRERRGHSVSDA